MASHTSLTTVVADQKAVQTVLTRAYNAATLHFRVFNDGRSYGLRWHLWTAHQN
jgi:hypothetical protein